MSPNHPFKSFERSKTFRARKPFFEGSTPMLLGGNRYKMMSIMYEHHV